MIFASTKPLTALILNELSAVRKLLDFIVCPKAIRSELINIKHSLFFLKKYIQFLKESNRTSFNDKLKKEIFYQYYSSKFLKYTLVMHPIGRHLDTFADNYSSLENRVFFHLISTKMVVLVFVIQVFLLVVVDQD